MRVPTLTQLASWLKLQQRISPSGSWSRSACVQVAAESGYAAGASGCRKKRQEGGGGREGSARVSKGAEGEERGAFGDRLQRTSGANGRQLRVLWHASQAGGRLTML